MAYYSWSLSGLSPNAPQYSSCSPNLAQLNHYISQKWGGRTLGCKVTRPIAGSDRWSTHAYGAAIDIRLPSEPNRLYAVAFMMDHFAVLGLNAIHDYRRQMIFKDDGQWHSASIGSLGQDWWHVEVTPAAYSDGRPVEEKLGGPPPPPPPPPNGVPPYDPLHHKYGLWPAAQPKPEIRYGYGYTNGTQQLQGVITYFKHTCVCEMGQIMSEPWGVALDDVTAAVRNVNNFFNKDGSNRALAIEAWGEGGHAIVGTETWKIIDFLANRQNTV